MEHRQQYRFGRKLLTVTIATIISGLAAAEIQAQEAAGETLEEITVTGSRVRIQDGMTAPTPVTAITFDELSNFNPGSTVAEQLDSLPQFFSTVTAPARR